MFLDLDVTLYLRYHVRHKFCCGCHGVFEEINNDSIEPFSQGGEPSECLLLMADMNISDQDSIIELTHDLC